MRLLAGFAAVCLFAAQPDRQAAERNAAAYRLFKQAEAAEHDGKVVEAYLLFAKAAAADPYNQTYWTRAAALRVAASAIGESKLPALGQVDKPAPALNPDLVGSLTRRQIQDIERMTEPPRLRPAQGLKSFHLRGAANELFEQVAAAYGYTVIFDKDYTAQQTVRFDVNEADYKGALHALEAATNSFIVVLSEKAMLVAQDTPPKRQDLEPNEALGIPIPQRTSLQEAQELTLMVQQALEIRRVSMDPGKRLVYMRDRASKIELARALFSQLSAGKPQISAEIEFLSVGHTSSLDFGLKLPTQYPLVDFGPLYLKNRNSVSIPAGFARFLSFGGGLSFMGLGIADGGLFATATRSDATSLLRTTVTASDGQAATFHVGDKYPIQTGAYLGLGGIGGGGGGSFSTTYAVISTASYADISTVAVSATGKMKLVINGQDYPFTLPAGYNNIAGLMSIINSAGTPVGIQPIQRGTKDRPYSLLVVASTLGISSIQLYDDPDGAKIALLKTPDTTSSISAGFYADPAVTKVSANGILNLTVGETTTPLLLNESTNNLNGLRDAINSASAGVSASVLTTGQGSNPYYLQIVASSANTGEIQVYDDPDNAKTALFKATDEVNAFAVAGKTVSTGGSSSSLYAQAYTPPPTFNFEDLGLVLKITPFVHDLDEVTLDIEAEFKVLGTGSYNGVPVISTRKYQGKVRLRTNEYAIVAGLISETEARTLSGLAGLSDTPVLGPLFRENKKSQDRGEVLLVIKPRVTALPASEFPVETFWFGAETKPLTLL